MKTEKLKLGERKAESANETKGLRTTDDETEGKAGSAGSAAEGFIDKEAVAKRLGLRPRTVGLWAQDGRLPAFRFGRYLRFKWDEVERALASSCRVQREEKQKAD